MKSCLEKNNITVLKWPALSPDFNPNEDLSNHVEEYVRTVKAKNLKDLCEEVQKAWHAIPKWH